MKKLVKTLTEFKNHGLKNPKKADLNKDGKLSDYEEKRGAAIEKNIKELDSSIPLGKDFTYDYEDIGQFYLEGFGKEHTLTQDQLGKLGKMITNRFYGGDIKKAYDDVYKTSQNSAVNRLASKGQLINPMTIDKAETSVTEEEEVFNPDAKVKKNKGLAKAKEELALLTREMKSLAKKYSKAEGADKEKLVKTLKVKTKLKKELENILDNKKI